MGPKSNGVYACVLSMHDGPSMHGGLVEHFPFRNEHRFVLEMSPFVLSLRRAMSSSLKRCCSNATVTAAAAALPCSAPRRDPTPCGGRSGDALLRLDVLLVTTTMSRAR